MVCPSTYLALRDPDVYDKPDEFDPERYYTGDAEEKGAKNYLVFGLGTHYCLGQLYAQHNLALMIGKASMMLEWAHHPTPQSEEIQVFACIFPEVRRISMLGGAAPHVALPLSLIESFHADVVSCRTTAPSL